jgi:cysteine synthase A
VVLTPAAQKGSGMLAKAQELATKHGWFFVRQFENEANAAVHIRTTAQEILEAFKGERLDAWVTGFGTGGTLKGVATVLRAQRPETRVIACEPDNLPSAALAAAACSRRRASASHPYDRTAVGWAPDFVPRLTETLSGLGSHQVVR